MHTGGGGARSLWVTSSGLGPEAGPLCDHGSSGSGGGGGAVGNGPAQPVSSEP